MLLLYAHPIPGVRANKHAQARPKVYSAPNQSGEQIPKRDRKLISLSSAASHQLLRAIEQEAVGLFDE